MEKTRNNLIKDDNFFRTLKYTVPLKKMRQYRLHIQSTRI